MADAPKPEGQDDPKPVIDRIGADKFDSLIAVNVGGKEVDMTLREALERAGAAENVSAMERDLTARSQRFGQEAQLGRQVASLVRDGRHAEAQALVRQMAGVTEDNAEDDGEPVSPAVQRQLRQMHEELASLRTRSNAKDTERQLHALMDKQKLFREVPEARARAEKEILAELMMNPDANMEAVVREKHTEHARYLEVLVQRQAEQRRETARETRTVAGAGGSPEIVPQMEKPLYSDLKDKTKRAKLIDGLKSLQETFARAQQPPV